LAGKTYSHDIFPVEGFSYKDQIDKLFIVMDYCMYSQHVTFSTFINFTFLTATYFSKAWYSLFVLKLPLNPSQSFTSAAVDLAAFISAAMSVVC